MLHAKPNCCISCIAALMTLLLQTAVLLALPEGGARADADSGERARHDPKICNGYSDAGWLGRFGEEQHPDCPEGNVLSSLLRWKTFVSGAPETVPAVGQCCALPADDILLPQSHVLADYECPADHVATGSHGSQLCRDCTKKLRCTKINTARYQLGPKRAGVYWGFGGTHWHEPKTYLLEDVPAALRYSLGRERVFERHSNGCIGEPFGSLLVEKRFAKCRGYFFRELQYRGLPGDPPAGTPVQMFPHCDDLNDIYEPHPECLRFQEARE